jgi:anti-sigma B factor antagonist
MTTRTPQPASGTWVENGPLRIRSEREPNELYVVEPYGELDLAAGKTLDAELRRIEASDVDRIIIDLSGLDFIDSSGIQVLMEAEARSRQDSNRVRFLHGRGQVARILELIQADSVLSFAD